MLKDRLVGDVLVVGAGPGGIATALRLRSRGMSVTVLDKAAFPRDKTCGDGLTAEALRTYRRLGFDPMGLDGCAPVSETVLRSPSGRLVSLPTAPDLAGIVRRAELDAAFVGHARDAGVEVREATRVVEVTPAADSVAVVLDDDAVLRAPFVVAADGHWSVVRRRVEQGRGVDLGGWHAERQYFAGVEDPRLWVLFRPELLPGYAWVFPLPDGRANVGFGVLRHAGLGGKELGRLRRGLLASPGLHHVLGPDAKAEGSPRAWPIPTGYDPVRLADHRVLYVGDAAQVVDPMTGEGIAQALSSGILAADALAQSDDPDRVAASYRRAISRVLGRDLRFSALLGRILRSPLGARASVRAAGLTAWTRRSFARWLYEDYPRAVLLTPDRWVGSRSSRSRRFAPGRPRPAPRGS